MRRSGFLLISGVIFLTGCANMIDKPFQQVTVSSPGVMGADCFLETSDNRYHVITPGVTQIERSREDLKVTCRKPGYIDKGMAVESRLRIGSSFFNVFNGVVPGTAYDIVSNSIYGYPNEIVVDLEKMPESPMIEPEAATTSLKKKPVEPVAGMMPTPEQKSQVDNSLSHSLRK